MKRRNSSSEDDERRQRVRRLSPPPSQQIEQQEAEPKWQLEPAWRPTNDRVTALRGHGRTLEEQRDRRREDVSSRRREQFQQIVQKNRERSSVNADHQPSTIVSAESAILKPPLYSTKQNDNVRQPELTAPPVITISGFTEQQQLEHVLRVVNAAVPLNENGKREWLGLRTFLCYYFASTLKMFLGQRSVVRVVLTTNDNDLSARFYRLENNRFLVMLVCNFDYWDDLLSVSTALPDIYFSPAPRFRLTDATLRAQPSPVQPEAATTRLNGFVVRDGSDFQNAPPSPSDNPTDPCTDAQENEGVLDKAVSALGLVHLFEIMMHHDFETKAPGYVTLAQMFTGGGRSVNPFTIETCVRDTRKAGQTHF